MREGMFHFERLMVAIPCITIIAICVLLIAYRMVSADLDFLPGMGAITLLIVVMYFCVSPPHPLVPAVALVSILALMISYPFVEKQLEDRELRAYDVSRLERAFAALEQKQDNPSAAFEAARWLWQQGFKHDAIAIAEGTLAKLDTKRDEVKNTSLRDMFRTEEGHLRAWKREPLAPEPPKARTCPACNTVNAAGALRCTGCNRPYLLDKAKLADFRDRVGAKLVLSYAAVCGLIVGGASIGMAVEGPMRWVAVLVAVGLVGGLLAFLLKPPTATRT